MKSELILLVSVEKDNNSSHISGQARCYYANREGDHSKPTTHVIKRFRNTNELNCETLIMLYIVNESLKYNNNNNHFHCDCYYNQHPNSFQYHFRLPSSRCFYTDIPYSIIFPYYQTNLFTFLSGVKYKAAYFNPFSNGTNCILLQILCSLKILHDLNILWIDCKPSNIFLNVDKYSIRCVLGDFGLSVKLQEGRKRHNFLLKDSLGTRAYHAPEKLRPRVFKQLSIEEQVFSQSQNEKIETMAGYATTASDIYSLGIVFGELFLQKNYIDLHNDKALQKVKKEEYENVYRKTLFQDLTIETLQKHHESYSTARCKFIINMVTNMTNLCDKSRPEITELINDIKQELLSINKSQVE